MQRLTVLPTALTIQFLIFFAVDATMLSNVFMRALRERIADLREGAFATYTQQPLLRAVLLPLLTYGGSTLLDYLSLLNL